MPTSIKLSHLWIFLLFAAGGVPHFSRFSRSGIPSCIHLGILLDHSPNQYSFHHKRPVISVIDSEPDRGDNDFA